MPRISEFPAAALPATDDYIGVDGDTNGTRKLAVATFLPLPRMEALPDVSNPGTTAVNWGSSLIYTDAEMPAGTWLVSAQSVGAITESTTANEGNRAEIRLDYSLDGGSNWTNLQATFPTHVTSSGGRHYPFMVQSSVLSFVTTGSGLRFRIQHRDIDAGSASRFFYGVIECVRWRRTA